MSTTAAKPASTTSPVPSTACATSAFEWVQPMPSRRHGAESPPTVMPTTRVRVVSAKVGD
ncbi:MAG: hypothetical protein EBX38_04175 [Actinobacteria bacterium]|nr:hypothetical protein [Actinomycetota bacterium]